jgi:hypothetical protein
VSRAAVTLAHPAVVQPLLHHAVMKHALLAIALLGCRDSSVDLEAPERQPANEPPAKPARKEILPAQGMLCKVTGSGDHAWWPDGRMTKLELHPRAFTSRDGTVYEHDYATKGLAPVDQKGPDDTRVIAKGLDRFTTIAIDSPTKMVAWEHGDKESMYELVGGSWKAGALPPRPADDTYSLQAVAYGPGDALWVLRSTGLFVRGANGYEEIALDSKPHTRHVAMATTPEAVYVLADSRLLRIDAARKVTVVASWEDGRLMDGALAVAKTGRVLAYANRFRSSFVLTVGDAGAKATRTDLPDARALLAVDAAGRTWVRRTADVLVIDADNTRHVYPPGSLPLFPAEDNGACTPLGGGFAKLPAATAKHTGTLQLKFSGAENGELELCAKPDGARSPSPCDGAAERITGTLDQYGMRRLVVPTGTWEAAIQLDGKWYVKDFSRTGYNTTNTSCDITSGETCSIEMRVVR